MNTNHDPKCPMAQPCQYGDIAPNNGDNAANGHYPANWCHGCEQSCRCAFIAEIRADERNRVMRETLDRALDRA